jgi:Putative Mg2+ and Co2+ transporter CorB
LDDISTSTLFIALGVLILLSAYFSSSETGMMSINRYRLKHLQGEGNRSAIRVAKLLDRPDRLIGLILIGNNLVNIAASSLATILCIRLFGDYWGLFAATFGLTLVLLIFAEVTPKNACPHCIQKKFAFPSFTYSFLPLLTLTLFLLWAANKME